MTSFPHTPFPVCPPIQSRTALLIAVPPVNLAVLALSSTLSDHLPLHPRQPRAQRHSHPHTTHYRSSLPTRTIHPSMTAQCNTPRPSFSILCTTKVPLLYTCRLHHKSTIQHSTAQRNKSRIHRCPVCNEANLNTKTHQPCMPCAAASAAAPPPRVRCAVAACTYLSRRPSIISPLHVVAQVDNIVIVLDFGGRTTFLNYHKRSTSTPFSFVSAAVV